MRPNGILALGREAAENSIVVEKAVMESSNPMAKDVGLGELSDKHLVWERNLESIHTVKQCMIYSTADSALTLEHSHRNR